jgi:hypothetical protein
MTPLEGSAQQPNNLAFSYETKILNPFANPISEKNRNRDLNIRPFSFTFKKPFYDKSNFIVTHYCFDPYC